MSRTTAGRARTATRWGLALALATSGLAASAAGADRAAAASASFTSSAGIAIPATGTAGPASPYPSAVVVSGLPGQLTDVDVTLTGLSHGLPQDLGIVLVAPNGDALMLMDYVSDQALAGSVDLTFDDSASTQLPRNGTLTSGTFRPTQHLTGDTFPDPGPGRAYANPGPEGGGTATLASVFGGDGANGAWKLYVGDFEPTNTGALTGWSLDLTTREGGGAPESTVTRGPKRKTYKKKATFGFVSTGGAAFQCSLDRAAFAPCSSPATYRKLRVGRHRFSVRAVDAAGHVEATPATYRWKIRKRKKRGR